MEAQHKETAKLNKNQGLEDKKMQENPLEYCITCSKIFN